MSDAKEARNKQIRQMYYNFRANLSRDDALEKIQDCEPNRKYWGLKFATIKVIVSDIKYGKRK